MPMKKLALAVSLAAVLAGGTTEASAQTLEPPRARQGYFIGLGLLSAAVTQSWDRGEPLGAGVGGGFTFRMGQLLTRRFGLGLQIESGASKTKHVQSTAFSLGLESQFELAHNLAATGGVGLGVVSVKDDRDPDAGLRGAFGAAYSLGLSYDWFFTNRLTGGWSVTPRFTARFIPGDDIKAVVGVFAVEIHYWTGLPHNQLALPEAEAYRK